MAECMVWLLICDTRMFSIDHCHSQWQRRENPWYSHLYFQPIAAAEWSHPSIDSWSWSCHRCIHIGQTFSLDNRYNYGNFSICNLQSVDFILTDLISNQVLFSLHHHELVDSISRCKQSSSRPESATPFSWCDRASVCQSFPTENVWHTIEQVLLKHLVEVSSCWNQSHQPWWTSPFLVDSHQWHIFPVSEPHRSHWWRWFPRPLSRRSELRDRSRTLIKLLLDHVSTQW